MDSKLYGMPLSTTPSPPPPPKVPSGIRAPLTTDSDFEYEYEYSNGQKSSSYNSSTYTSESEEGFLSGEDGFETASERPFVADPDDETIEETHYVNEYVVSRPFVNYTQEENFQRNSNFRPFVTTPDDNVEESSNLSEYGDSRPYLTDQDDEFVEDNIHFRPSVRVPIENEYASIVNGVAPKVEVDKQGIPIAQLSCDLSDDGSVQSLILEDDECSSVVRIPDAEVLERCNGVPKVKVLEVEEGERSESESERMLESDIVKDSNFSAVDVNEALSSQDEEEHIVLKDHGHGFELAEVVLDKVLDISEGVDDNSLVENQECIMLDVMHSEEQIQERQSDHVYGISEESKLIGIEAAITPEEDYSSPCESLYPNLLKMKTEDYLLEITQSHVMASELLNESEIPDPVLLESNVIPETITDVNDDPNILVEEEEGRGGALFLHDDAEGLTIKDSDEAVGETEQLNERFYPASNSMDEISGVYSETDGQVMTGSDEEMVRDEEYQGKEIFDSTGGNVTITSADGNTIYSVEDNLSEEAKKKVEKLQEIGVNYLRILHKLNRSSEDPIASQVLYQLVLAARRPPVEAFSLESAKKLAMELEAESTNDLNVSLNILVIGKTGVGKSATINSIFGDERVTVGAFEHTTTNVKEINGNLNGVKIRVWDTPGLRSSISEQSVNRKILSSIKKSIKKFSPDVVLYVDRLDMQTRDVSDLPMLKSITRYLGSAIWRNCIITLTHAASASPDGPFGYPLSYEVFVGQRSRLLQQMINHSVSDGHMIARPVSVVENNPCEKIENGENCTSRLMLLCYSTKILSQIASVVKTDDRKLFRYQTRSPPLLYLLTSLLQPIVHPKLSTDQGDSDIEMAYSFESDQEDEDEYDQLPLFKPLRKSQIAELTMDQRKAYFEEYDYHVKLLEKKQLREEVKMVREMKKGKDGEQEMGSSETVAVPLPDMVLPLSFDGDNPGYRYRFLEPEPSSHLLTRPVLDSNGWDHDCGYDGVSIEDNLAIANRFPAAITLQLTKDKKEFNFNLNSSVSAKHGENGSTMAGLDIQTIRKQLAYILKSEFKARNYRINKTAAGLSVTFLDENVVTGIKVKDHIAIGKRLALMGNTGVSFCKGDAAYGGNLEIRLREKDYPIGQDESMLSLSAMKWRGDLLWGCNVDSQFSIGRNSKFSFRAGLNNKGNGQISIMTSSSDQLQIALLALIPVATTIYRHVFLQSSE